MRRGCSGRYESTIAGGEVCRAFVPDALPPHPSLILDVDLQERLDHAHLALGELNAVEYQVPDGAILLYSFMRKEAVMSSRIEGTQSSLADLLLYEAEGAPGAPIEDVQEVSRYLAALEYGMAQLQAGMPLCSRLMNDMHGRLMAQGRGAGKAPGAWRRTQNWIGGASASRALFVPPPPQHLARCLTDLERFLNDQPERHSPLHKAALAHVQFETIHPYLDGNGRLGRLLIPLILVHEGVLRQPWLYVSNYFKAWRKDYYELLQAVREHGDWEEWLWFFATAVRQSAVEATTLARTIKLLFAKDGGRLRREVGDDPETIRVYHSLFSRPVARRRDIAALADVDPVAVDRSLQVLVALGFGRLACGMSGESIFVYTAYLDLLNREDP